MSQHLSFMSQEQAGLLKRKFSETGGNGMITQESSTADVLKGKTANDSKLKN